MAQSYAILIPGVSAPLGVANNVGNSFSLADLSFHGARESQVAVDGFETSHRFNDGAEAQDRTADLRFFRAALYRLSYLTGRLRLETMASRFSVGRSTKLSYLGVFACSA